MLSLRFRKHEQSAKRPLELNTFRLRFRHDHESGRRGGGASHCHYRNFAEKMLGTSPAHFFLINSTHPSIKMLIMPS